MLMMQYLFRMLPILKLQPALHLFLFVVVEASLPPAILPPLTFDITRQERINLPYIFCNHWLIHSQHQCPFPFLLSNISCIWSTYSGIAVESNSILQSLLLIILVSYRRRNSVFDFLSSYNKLRQKIYELCLKEK